MGVSGLFVVGLSLVGVYVECMFVNSTYCDESDFDGRGTLDKGEIKACCQQGDSIGDRLCYKARMETCTSEIMNERPVMCASGDVWYNAEERDRCDPSLPYVKTHQGSINSRRCDDPFRDWWPEEPEVEEMQEPQIQHLDANPKCCTRRVHCVPKNVKAGRYDCYDDRGRTDYSNWCERWYGNCCGNFQAVSVEDDVMTVDGFSDGRDTECCKDESGHAPYSRKWGNFGNKHWKYDSGSSEKSANPQGLFGCKLNDVGKEIVQQDGFNLREHYAGE